MKDEFFEMSTHELEQEVIRINDCLARRKAEEKTRDNKPVFTRKQLAEFRAFLQEWREEYSTSAYTAMKRSTYDWVLNHLDRYFREVR